MDGREQRAKVPDTVYSMRQAENSVPRSLTQLIPRKAGSDAAQIYPPEKLQIPMHNHHNHPNSTSSPYQCFLKYV